MCLHFCAVCCLSMEPRGGHWLSSFIPVHLFMIGRSCHQALPLNLDWPLSTHHHPLPQGWGHTATVVLWRGSCCPDTFSTELFSQTDRYFKVLMDSYFSKLGNGESSNTKVGIQLSRYLRGYLAVHSVLGGYRVGSMVPALEGCSTEVTI